MARRVFFSFHNDDVKTFRANVVRKHDMLKGSQESGFFDYSIWEDAKGHGDSSIKRLINLSLEGTSTTCVLIGTNTWSRRWVRYEILKSHQKGNKLFGVHINSIRDRHQHTFPSGSNPFDSLGFTISSSGKSLTYHEHDGDDWHQYQDLPISIGNNFAVKHRGQGFTLSSWVPVYDWVADNGYHNFPYWVESAK